MTEEKKHNLKVQAEIKELTGKIEALKATIKKLPDQINPPLHILAQAKKKLPKSSKPKKNAVKIKSPEVAKKKTESKKSKG
tara:strand:+ start:182 stop:424 length:243 start_codon:yes stop_codon:yes gene_type:complete